MKSIIYFTLGLSLILSVSCKKKQKEDEIKVEFNRSKLLSNFANNIIIVRYQSLNQSILDLETAFTYFKTTSDSANLVNLRLNYLDAYTKWQGCSSFEFGPAENNGLKTYLNTYPTDTNKIINNITTGGYNLATASNINATGFPALDYILYKKNNVYNTLNYYTNTPTAITYLENVINQAKTLISLVLNEWQNSYASTFKNADGTDAGSSMSKVINTLNKDFETYIRDGKVGIPLGIRSLGNILPTKSEALYSKKSLVLLSESINNLQSYFNGNGVLTGTIGLDDYLNHLEAKHGSDLLASKINAQFYNIKVKTNQLNNSISKEVVNNKPLVQELYDELQKMVILLKVDLSSALSILISYQDNDGD